MNGDSVTVDLRMPDAAPAQELLGVLGVSVGTFFLVGLVGMLFGRRP